MKENYKDLREELNLLLTDLDYPRNLWYTLNDLNKQLHIEMVFDDPCTRCIKIKRAREIVKELLPDDCE